MIKWFRYLVFAGLLTGPFANASDPRLTHGVTVGDVTHDQAVIWARAHGPGFLHAQVASSSPKVRLTRNNDFTGKIVLTNLKPDKRYRYAVWFDESAISKRSKQAYRGEFRTAPKPDQATPVTFLWSGDLGGQNVCRDKAEGYPIFEVISKERYDFFIGLGDMIYADGVCEEVGTFGNDQVPGEFSQSKSLEDFWAHWRYNLGDPNVRRTLSQAPYFAIWDDHEIINDFGPSTTLQNGKDLLGIGLKAFLDYNPVRDQQGKIYRTVRWGQHLEVFFLDTRQYRDPNANADVDSANKTLLGDEQKQWLMDSVTQSSATWKLIVSSVPISVPTGFPATNGRDGWANFDQDTGFEFELAKILTHFQNTNTRNLFWITTDVHFAAVYEYAALASQGEPLVFHEAMVGPLSANIYPTQDLDDTFNPARLFFYAPAEPIQSFAQSKRWMNYGRVHIAEDGNLTLSVINGLGDEVFGLELEPR